MFGCVPRFPGVDSKLLHQQSRMDALSRVRTEMATIVGEMRMHNTLARRVSSNADLIIESGD